MKKAIYLAAIGALMTGVLSPSHGFAQKFSKNYPAVELLAAAEACARIGLLADSDVDFDQLERDPLAKTLVSAVERVNLDPKACYQPKLNHGQLRIISGNDD